MIYPIWRFLLLLIPIPVLSQPPNPKNYPRNYFANPLHVPISLAANFGELRANHFHMGLDIRTEKRENLPVFASAGGYIARISIAPFGFGQAIYINHPNGYTTVYGHLNAFYPALAEYIKKLQYLRKTWAITLEFTPTQFTLAQGDLIGYSGNTGGSQGPHLHFEIRKTAEEINLNPQLFSLPIPDNKPPVIQRLAVYDGDRSVYEQKPRLLPVIARAGGYGISGDTLILSAPKAGFAITCFDSQSGSNNPNGIYQADLFNNQRWVIGFEMDGISYDYTRGVNAHIDYKTKASHGPWLQQLFQLPGYLHSIYKADQGNGFLDLRDGAVHAIQILVRDAQNNKTALNFFVQYRNKSAQRPQVAAASLLPDRPPLAIKAFYPLTLNALETPDAAVYVGEKGVYDSVHFSLVTVSQPQTGAPSGVYSIGATYVPLDDPMVVRLRLAKGFDAGKKERVLMQRTAGEETETSRVEWKGDWATARFRDFGQFQLVSDESAPVIKPAFKAGANLKKARAIAINVTDNFHQIRNFRALLDGQWLLFSNDKERRYLYVFDAHCPAGNHELVITAEDLVGNTATSKISFTR